MRKTERKKRTPGTRAAAEQARRDRQRRVVAAVEASYVAQLSRHWNVPRTAPRPL
jgi:hypothetical protein